MTNYNLLNINLHILMYSTGKMWNFLISIKTAMETWVRRWFVTYCTGKGERECTESYGPLPAVPLELLFWLYFYLKAFPWIVTMLDRLKITKHNSILFPLLEVSNQEKALKKSTSVSPFQTCTDTCPFIHMCLAIACQAFISNHSINSKKIHHACSPSERKLLFIT